MRLTPYCKPGLAWVCVLLMLAMRAFGGDPPARDDAVHSAPTFTKDIAPMLYHNCVSCHRPGEVAPFALRTYGEVKKRAKQIADVTSAHLMPPWRADAGAETFLDARRLSDEQIHTFEQWAINGMPEGNPADLPELPKFVDGWQLGEPELVLQPEAPYHLAADGPDVYRCFVLKTDYAEDRYVSAMEVRAGNRKIVHHVMGYVDATRVARRLEGGDGQPGYSAFGGVGFAPTGTLDGWGPGVSPRLLPDGIGMLLPKGSDIVIQVHYHPSGKPETDLTRIGLHFARKPVDKRLNMAVALNPGLRIAAGESNHEERASFDVPTDITLVRIAPHMHLLGRDMTVTASYPDGHRRQLVRVPEWDFRWQTIFSFRDPVRLPRGSRVEVVAHYDNSVENIANPVTPPREVRWGEQTTDEMCVAALFYTLDAEHLTQGKAVAPFVPPPGSGGDARQAMLDRRRLAMQMFDKNHDGKLDEQEKQDALKFIENLRGGMTPDQRAGAKRFLDSLNDDGK